MPKFSIIIPTYEHAELLKRALQSVIMQDFEDWEVIICDDSKSDNVKAYAESMQDTRISYVKHDKGETAAENWNFGLSKAQGEHIILMHHDEAIVSPNHLSLIAQKMKENEVVISDVEVLYHGKKRHRLTTHLTQRFVSQHPKLLFFQNTIGPTACLAFRRNQMQLFNPHLTWFVDVEWYYRMLKGKQVLNYPTCKIQSIHGQEGQISQHLDVIKVFRKDKAILCKIYSGKIRLALWLYEHLILGTKKRIGKI